MCAVKFKLYSRHHIDRNERIPLLSCLHRCWLSQIQLGGKIIHIACILMSCYRPIIFLLAVNRNEAVFLQAWLTTRREACLSGLCVGVVCVYVCVSVYFGGVTQLKPNKQTPFLKHTPSSLFFFFIPPLSCSCSHSSTLFFFLVPESLPHFPLL